MRTAPLQLAALLLILPVMACGGGDAGSGAADASQLTGRVQIDGSSTVFPITAAVAEDFQALHRGVRVTVGVSGTGGGFKRFCAGETDISDASRPIKPSEAELCAQNGVEFVEVPVAWDGLSVMVNIGNGFADCLTVDELKRIWEPGSGVTTWRDVRPEFPAEAIRLYGPGTDSGTFDYFTEVIVGEGGESRPDYQASEDDNILVQGIAGDDFSLGYMGFAYYVENTDKLALVAVDGGSGCVEPSRTTIEDGSYAPLSRPLFVYVSRAAMERAEVAAFLEFMIENAGVIIPSTGYVPLTSGQYETALSDLAGPE